eukprot:SAG25_NODE_332_length_9639_cov_3.140776_6_plen_214_part_00
MGSTRRCWRRPGKRQPRQRRSRSSRCRASGCKPRRRCGRARVGRARGVVAWAIGGRCTALTRSRLAQERRREKDAARIEKLLADQQQWGYLQRKAAVEEAAAASGYIRSLEETLYESSQADSESEMAVSVEENDAHADHRISASDRATPQTQPRVVVPAVAESPSAETRAQIDAELLAALRSRRAALPGAINKKARHKLAKKIRAMEQVPTTF